MAATRPYGLFARILLTLAGAAGLIVGGFMDWTQGLTGVDISGRAFYQSVFVHDGNFVTTVGFVMIVLGLVAIVGLAPRSGWLTRLAGALGIAGLVLFVIQLSRAHVSMPGSIQAGPWVSLAGAIVTLIGGFFGTRAVVTAAPAGSSATVVE